MEKEKVIIASRNQGKIEEISNMLAKYGIDAVSRDEFGVPKFEVEETGSTFEENSLLKAETIMSMVNMPVIADDSGLEVYALGGAPGVYSARYAGEGCTMQDNRDKMLFELGDIPDEKRTARFATVITLLYPDGEKLVARGECEGKIIAEERGEKGFGYDPIFVPFGYDITFAEMSQEEKNAISHRGKALILLEDLIRGRDK